MNSPEHAVSSKWVTIPRTVTRPAAVLMETPVSHHAPVAVGSAYSRFADAVSIGGVAERAVSRVEGQGAPGVTVTCWRWKDKPELTSYV